MTHSQPAIDWKLTLTLCNGRADLAEQLLNMLAEELPTHKKAIKNAYEKKQFDVMANHVHKLLGASSYCGVPTLQEICLQLEIKLKTNKTTQLTDQLTLLYQAVDAIIH